MKNTTDLTSFFRNLQVSKEALSDHESADNPYISRSEMIKNCSQKAPVIPKANRKLRRDNTFDLNNRPNEIQIKTNRSFPDKRLTSSTLEKFLKIILEKPVLSERKDNRESRIRYASCELRSSIEELCHQKFMISALQVVKKWANYNLSVLINGIRVIYQQEISEDLKALLFNLTKLLTLFEFASIFDLKYTQCKVLVGEVEKLEYYLHERFFNTQQLNGEAEGQETKNPSRIELNEAYGKFDDEINQSRIKRRNKSMNFKNEIHWTKQVAQIILKAKYTICRLGLSLNYAEITNSFKGSIKVKLLKLFGETEVAEAPKLRNIKKRGSISEFKKQEDSIFEKSSTADLKYLLTLRIDTLNTTSSFTTFLEKRLNGHEETKPEAVAQKELALKNHLNQKVKKWLAQKMRKHIENKRKELEESLFLKLRSSKLPCKICAKQIVAEKLGEHSTNCRGKNELINKISNVNGQINDDIFQAFRRSRELQTKNLVLTRNFQKLKSKFISNFKSKQSDSDKKESLLNIEQPESLGFQKHKLATQNNISSRVSMDSEEGLSTTQKISVEKAPSEETPKNMQTKQKKKAILTKAKTFNIKLDQQTIIPEEEDDVKSPERRVSRGGFLKSDSIHQPKEPVIIENFQEEEAFSRNEISRRASPITNKSSQRNTKTLRVDTMNGFPYIDSQNQPCHSNHIGVRSLNSIPFEEFEKNFLNDKYMRRAKSLDLERFQGNSCLFTHSSNRRFITEGDLEISDELTTNFKRDSQYMSSQLSDSPSFSSGDTLNLYVERSETSVHRSKFFPNTQVVMGQLDQLDKTEDKTLAFPQEKSEVNPESQLDSNFFDDKTSELKQSLVPFKLDFNAIREDRDDRNMNNSMYETPSSKSKVTALLQPSKRSSENSLKLEKLSTHEEIHKELKTIKTEIEDNIRFIGLYEGIKDLGKYIASEDTYTKKMALNLNEFKTRMAEFEKINTKSESIEIASKFLEHFGLKFELCRQLSEIDKKLDSIDGSKRAYSKDLRRSSIKLEHEDFVQKIKDIEGIKYSLCVPKSNLAAIMNQF